MWETDGFFQTQEEVDAYYSTYSGSFPNQGNTGLRPGDVIKVDRNEDGVITSENGEDLKFMGDLSPHYTYGVNLGAGWKGIDFQVTFQGVLDQNIYRQEETFQLLSRVAGLQTKLQLFWEKHGLKATQVLNIPE